MEAESPRLRCLQGWFLMRPLSLSYRWPSSMSSHVVSVRVLQIKQIQHDEWIHTHTDGYVHLCLCRHLHRERDRVDFKELACTIVQGTWVWPLGWEDPLEKEMTTHSSTLAWEIPWTEEPDGLQSMGSQRIRHNLATKQQQQFPNTVLLWNLGG